MMHAWQHPEDKTWFQKHTKQMVDLAEETRAVHYQNYRNVVSPSIADMYNSPVFAIFLPTGGFWTSERYRARL